MDYWNIECWSGKLGKIDYRISDTKLKKSDYRISDIKKNYRLPSSANHSHIKHNLTLTKYVLRNKPNRNTGHFACFTICETEHFGEMGSMKMRRKTINKIFPLYPLPHRPNKPWPESGHWASAVNNTHRWASLTRNLTS